MQQEVSNVEKPKFECLGHQLEAVLQLILPPECDDLSFVSCSDKYDVSVPDLQIVLYLPSLITALKVAQEHADSLHHVAAKCRVDSENYEGKIRMECVKIYAHKFNAKWSYSFFLNFSNDWTGSVYFFDLSTYLHDFLNGYDNIIEKLEKLLVEA